jgi:hypothetical protein
MSEIVNLVNESSSSESESYEEVSSAETEVQEEKVESAPIEEKTNTEEDVEEGKENEGKTEENELKCIVCYTELNVKNIVNTQCDHKYCWECFFKWIKSNPTCPYCRCNFMSEDAWYENRDVNQDVDNLRDMANMLQLELIKTSTRLHCIEKRKKSLKRKVKLLERKRELNLQSIVSSNAQIEYMRGYHSALRGDEKDGRFAKTNFKSEWFRGFTMGVYEMQQEKYNIDYHKFNCFAKSILTERENEKFRKVIVTRKKNYVPSTDSESEEQDEQQEEELNEQSESKQSSVAVEV